MKNIKQLSKYIGIFLILAGIPILFIPTSAVSEMPLLIGLFTLLISNHDREDERSIAIRSSSAFFALIIGYTIKLVITNLYEHQLIDFNLISINYFLIIVFALANLIRFFRLYNAMA